MEFMEFSIIANDGLETLCYCLTLVAFKPGAFWEGEGVSKKNYHSFDQQRALMTYSDLDCN